MEFRRLKMAFVSLRVQRITAYLLVIVCVVLLYQFYNHGTFNRGKRKVNVPSMERNKRAAATSRNYNDLLLESRKNASKCRQQKDLLYKEINSLQLKLSNSLTLNRKLRNNMEAFEKKEERLKRHISKLKSHNIYLMDEIKNINNSRHHEFASKKEEKKTFKKPLIAENLAFNSFAKTHIYEPDSQPRPKEYMFRGQHRDTRIIKPVRKHIFEVEDKILHTINSNSSFALTREDALDGVYRYDVNTGADYEYYFKHPNDHSSVIPVRAWRALSEPHVQILPSVKKRLDEMINLVLPLSGRLERFQNFIDLFINVCIKKDKNVYLTVVLYGEKDFQFVKKILHGLEKDYGFRKYELVMRDKEFSRGRALNDGVIYWKGKDPNVLMFFCDVDITFSSEFLRRCRTYSEPGKQIYYPIVFSLYNPKNIYGDGAIPEPEAQLKIERNHGFWRTYGFGMTCQYRSDYLKVGGFDLSIEGWGSEDQQLYNRYLEKPEYRIIRAPDRDLFHFYHEKYCDPNLKWEQYRSCLGSKAKTEGTPAQISIQLTRLREKYEGFDKND